MKNFDQIPSPVLVTDGAGIIQSANRSLLKLSGCAAGSLVSKSMNVLFPVASRIFLQTHIWPMLLREDQVQEIRLQIVTGTGVKTPVFVNCQKTGQAGQESYTWIFFVTMERSRFEQDLLEARQRADALSAESARSERFIRTVADSLPSLIGYWDQNLICRFANAEYIKWFGKQPAEILGTHIKELLGETLFNRNIAYMQGALGGEIQEFEREIKMSGGETGYTLANYIPDRDASGEVKGFFALVTNISKLREANAAIRFSASVFDATSEGIMVTDVNSIIVSVNQAFTRLTGFSAEQAIGKNASLLNSTRHGREFFEQMYQELNLNGKWKGDVWSKRENESVFLARLSISAIWNDADEVTQYVGVFDDITKQWDRDQLVEHMAFHDGLTGLPNRLLLMERLGQLMAMASRERRQFALLFLDLDGFKSVNDLFGHDMGDHVLKTVAGRFLVLLRNSDTICRLGGDEFVILLDQPDSRHSIAVIAARLIATVNEPISDGDKSITVGTSIGIAIFQNDGKSADELLKLSDDAMYAAKKSGKNTFVFSDGNLFQSEY
ncbi:diguanylate cyclase (GGDEF)-like protein/PAS domain S-box-containing protein [Oxalobacteraceae bacterium GrIS 2.11]